MTEDPDLVDDPPHDAAAAEDHSILGAGDHGVVGSDADPTTSVFADAPTEPFDDDLSAQADPDTAGPDADTDDQLDTAAAPVGAVAAASLATAPAQPQLAPPELPDLRAWADAHGTTHDPYVAGLLYAVDHRQDLTMWAAIDPMEMLPHAEAKKGAFTAKVARVLLFLRNVLVFVPVAVTWFGIKEATEAFGAYAKAENAAGSGNELNFLLFWQSGGQDGTLAPAWRIQHIALVDALLIGLIVLLTLLSGAFEARAARHASREEQRLEAERTGVALNIRRALHGSRQSTPESISQSLAESLSDLLGGARLMNSAALRMETLSVGLETIGPKFSELNRRLDELGQRLSGELLTSVESLRASVVQLGTTVDGDLAQVLHKVMVGLDEIREQLGRTSASVEFGTKSLRDDLDAIHGRLSSVVRGGRP